MKVSEYGSFFPLSTFCLSTYLPFSAIQSKGSHSVCLTHFHIFEVLILHKGKFTFLWSLILHGPPLTRHREEAPPHQLDRLGTALGPHTPKTGLPVVCKRAVHPAEHETWPTFLMKHLNLANRTLAPPTPCVEMDLMSLCLVEIKGTTKSTTSPPLKRSVQRENIGVGNKWTGSEISKH